MHGWMHAHTKNQRKNETHNQTNEHIYIHTITLAVANVHFHFAVANNSSDVGSKPEKLKAVYDKLATRILEFKCRLVCGDFNMDALRVVTELRARGFCANVVSWFTWKRTGGEFHSQEVAILGSPQMQLDSVLIILIGPCMGMRVPFSPAVFDISQRSSVVADWCRLMQRVSEMPTGIM